MWRADTDVWSSFSVSVTPVPETYDADGNRLRSIIASDAPEHTPERRLMLPFFAPRAVEKYREHTQELCRRLIRDFIEDGQADIAENYARQIPPRIIAAILGIDPERADDFTTWVQGSLELGLQDPEIREHYSKIIREFFKDEIKDRIENPGGDDLISFLLEAELDGEPVPMHVIRGNVGLMLVAGDRHHLELDRFGAVAPGGEPRGSSASGRRTRADPHGHRRVPPGVRSGHDGQGSHAGHHP